MLIKEFTDKYKLTADTIRFYEKHGLISVGRKERRNNNYKEYSEEILRRLLHIKLLKSLGFTLNESSDVLHMIEVNEATCGNMVEKIDNKIRSLDEKIKEMQSVRNMLSAKMNECLENGRLQPDEENCPIVVPALDR